MFNRDLSMHFFPPFFLTGHPNFLKKNSDLLTFWAKQTHRPACAVLSQRFSARSNQTQTSALKIWFLFSCCPHLFICTPKYLWVQFCFACLQWFDRLPFYVWHNIGWGNSGQEGIAKEIAQLLASCSWSFLEKTKSQEKWKDAWHICKSQVA